MKYRFLRLDDCQSQIGAACQPDSLAYTWPQIGWAWASSPAKDVQLDALPFVQEYQPDAAVYGAGDSLVADGSWHHAAVGTLRGHELGLRGQNTLIAICDTGIDRETQGLRGVVTDGRNFIDPMRSPTDDHGHGTAVAYIAAARMVEHGGLGVAPLARLLSLKVLDRYNSGTWGAVVAAIMYAAESGAQIINLSLGSPDLPPAAVRESIVYAKSRGCAVVCAGGSTPNGKPFWPAAYDETVGVGATDDRELRADFSNYHDSVSIYAPGSCLAAPNNVDNSGISLWSGTSVSAPVVSGAIALLLSRYPNATMGRILAAIEESAKQLDYGGRLDIEAARQNLSAEFDHRIVVQSDFDLKDTKNGNRYRLHRPK